VPIWLVFMILGWTVFLGGNPYIRGVTKFILFTLQYDDSETVLCGKQIDSDSDDEDVDDFIEEMTPSPQVSSPKIGHEVVSEVQQWSWTQLKWVHLAWVPQSREQTRCPSNSMWSDLWGLDKEVGDKDGFEYTDGKARDDSDDDDDDEKNHHIDVTMIRECDDDLVIPSTNRKRLRRLDSSCPTSDAMWSLAVERFSQPPYSNGKDGKYKAVKSELKKLYGQNAINVTNESRLKYLAKSHGVRLKVSNYHKKPRSGDVYRRRIWRRHYRVIL